MSVYNFQPALVDEVPVLISIPHCGIEFPSEIKDEYDPALVTAPDDTDWFVDRLYDFAPSMGIPVLSAQYSRWVIDLNRDPHNKPLYTDGRIITALCPTTTFLGEPLYVDHRKQVSNDETERRLECYFWDYHDKIKQELERLKNKFGVVLLWDCHSIRQFVPTVYPRNFPDLILGDADGLASAEELSAAAILTLGSAHYSLSRNFPFKGGYITRHFGLPAAGQHALQLEMTKVNYMENDELHYSERIAEKMKIQLKATFEVLIEKLLNDSLSS
jgi:N-formylglutamate deformylase